MVSFSDLERQREHILRIARDHGAHDVRIFGSVARGDAEAVSDLDILVRLDSDRSLLDRIALIQDLEEILRCKVDVVNERALDASIRDEVLNEALAL
jgi:hypothetical protein